MSDKIDDGGPAFPVPVGITPGGDCFHSHYSGMSLRDWFAGQALALAAADIDLESLSKKNRSEAFAVALSRRAFAIADAMLAAHKGADHA